MNRLSLTNSPTPVCITIIAASVIILFIQSVPPSLALWPLESGYFRPWQVLTYSFLHGGFNHLFFNMFAVYMFGMPLERAWGSQRFGNYFFICVIGAAVIQLLVQLYEGGVYPTVGASGGVFGLLLAYGVTWPRNKLFLIFLPVPIEARWFVLIYGAVEFMFGVTNTLPGIAHFAHLGGLLFGAGLLYKWGWRPSMTWRR